MLWGSFRATDMCVFILELKDLQVPQAEPSFTEVGAQLREVSDLLGGT